MIMVPGETIEETDLEPVFGFEGEGEPISSAVDLDLREARELFERRFILNKLREHGGNVRRTAEALNIERSHLYRKMKSYGIDPGNIGSESTASTAGQ